jgi:hypothetical protein
VFNIRWGLITGLAAFIVSAVLGFVYDVRLFNIILRALLFGLVFFGFGIAIRFILNNFFPEMLSGGDDSPRETPVLQSGDVPGSRINITVGNSGEYALPESYRGAQEQELGNIEDLISGVFRPRSGIDRKSEDDYNGERGGQRAESSREPDREIFKIPNSPEFESVPFEGPVFTPAFSPSFGDETGGLGGLPDLDSMAMAFSTGYSGDSFSASGQAEDADPLRESSRHPKGNKPQPLKGDFNAEELAKGIRTVLSKDK